MTEPRAKPAYGSPCNGCGGCCKDTICPLGRTVLARSYGPCPALTPTEQGMSCGLMERPRQYFPIGVALHGAKAIREAVSIFIGAGHGCDALAEGEDRPPGTAQLLYQRAMAIPQSTIDRAARQLGLGAMLRSVAE